MGFVPPPEKPQGCFGGGLSPYPPHFGALWAPPVAPRSFSLQIPRFWFKTKRGEGHGTPPPNPPPNFLYWGGREEFPLPDPPILGRDLGLPPLPLCRPGLSFGLKSRDFGCAGSCQSTPHPFPRVFPPNSPSRWEFFPFSCCFSTASARVGGRSRNFGGKSQFWGFFHPISRWEKHKIPLPGGVLGEFSQIPTFGNAGGWMGGEGRGGFLAPFWC